MKAIRVHEFGGVDVLRLEVIDDPTPGFGEVVVGVRAAAINRIDLDVRTGASRFPITFPYTPGFEAVGEIEAVGPDTERWTVGDRVQIYPWTTCGQCAYCRTGRPTLCAESLSVSLHTPGVFAERVLCSASQLIALPDGLGFREAAAVEVAFGTSWHMLFARGGLRAGETVLVSSVGSGIGSAAIQLASWAGAFVIGTSSSEDRLDQARSLGMDAGINYTQTDVAQAVMELTDGRGADLAYEHVGGQQFQGALDALGKDGRLVTCGAHAGEVVSLDIIHLFRHERRIIGSFCYTQEEVARCLQLAAQGTVTPVVHEVYPLDRIADATTAMEQRSQFGKIVIEP